MAFKRVDTSSGLVEGTEDGGVMVWRGIPFGASTAGSSRFLPPVPPAPWDGVRKAHNFGPAAPQLEPVPLFRSPEPMPVSEDCLTLNVWSPAADDARRPVMVWIHGGAFEFGSGSTAAYDGAALARHGNIVVVTVNYRLGPFGFLYLGHLDPSLANSGIVGLLDQVAALRWVQDNIAVFGGDPHQVTVAGESAGALSVEALLVMPAARGLFQRAIVQSGLVSTRSAAQAAAQADRFIAELGVGASVEALRRAPLESLIAAAEQLRGQLTWRPVAEQVYGAASLYTAIEQGAAGGVALLIGTNRDEARLWTSAPAWSGASDDERIQATERLWGPMPSPLRDVYVGSRTGAALFESLVQYATDNRFWFPAQRLGALQAAHAPVYMYRFDWTSTAYGGALGACHALEIPFVFRNLEHPWADAFVGKTRGREALADQMHAAWINFVRTGSPNAPSLPPWPAYDLVHRPTMVFSNKSAVQEDLRGDIRRLWDAVEAAQPPGSR